MADPEIASRPACNARAGERQTSNVHQTNVPDEPSMTALLSPDSIFRPGERVAGASLAVTPACLCRPDILASPFTDAAAPARTWVAGNDGGASSGIEPNDGRLIRWSLLREVRAVWVWLTACPSLSSEPVDRLRHWVVVLAPGSWHAHQIQQRFYHANESTPRKSHDDNDLVSERSISQNGVRVGGGHRRRRGRGAVGCRVGGVEPPEGSEHRPMHRAAGGRVRSPIDGTSSELPRRSSRQGKPGSLSTCRPGPRARSAERSQLFQCQQPLCFAGKVRTARWNRCDVFGRVYRRAASVQFRARDRPIRATFHAELEEFPADGRA